MATDKTSIVMNLSPEVGELLADNEIDLVAELQNLYPDEEIIRDHTTVIERTGEGEKSVALIILASATAFYLISQGVERIINALGNNRVVVKQKNGTPAHEGEEVLTLLEPKVEEKSKSKISFLGLSVEFENERKQGK